jgi:hypothetical protein
VRFDAFVTDWMMPGIDGIENARHLRDLPGRPFVVLVSALGIPEARAHALGAGADEFFAKPMLHPKVVEAVAKALDGRADAGVATAAAKAPPQDMAGHPLARTPAWGAMPETLRRVVGELLQSAPELVTLDGPPPEASIRCVLQLSDAEHLVDLHAQIAATRSSAISLAGIMLGDPPPDDDATLNDLIAEVANVASGAIKSAFVPDGFRFTLGIADRGAQGKGHFALAQLVGLRSGSATLSLALGISPRNAVVVSALMLREGMVLAENLLNDNGALMLPLGTRLSATAVNRLQNVLRDRKIQVCIPEAA